MADLPTNDNAAPSATDAAQSAAPLSLACEQALDTLEHASQRRRLRVAQPEGKYISVHGKRLLNLAGNDYLGLSQHPRLIEAAVEATQQYGVGSGASRLVSGTSPLHEEVEHRFAKFKHAEAALLLPTGYAANLAVLTAVAGADDLIVMDKLVHASLIDAARASGAQVRTFPHLDLNRAEQLLKREVKGRRFLVTDSVFSMDGDCADLPALCDLADRTNASLIVDEAHGTGILGQTGAGLAEAQGVADRVYTCGSGGIVVSTASKALGSLGGLITAAKPIIDLIINKARPFIYSTAVPPAQAAAIGAAIDVIHDEPQRRQKLTVLSQHLRICLTENGWPLVTHKHAQCTPIIPLIIGDEAATLQHAKYLTEEGILAPAIRPPTVAPGSSRIRLSLRADLVIREINQIVTMIGHHQ